MPPNVQIALLGGVALALVALGAWIALRMAKANPERREKRRRLHVSRIGRLGDALIVEATDSLLYYTYSVHGVEYNASQDIAPLRNLLPAEPGRLIGVANLKYSPKNPANSILLCEEWSGLRAKGSPQPAQAPTLI
ncbi:MAG TPA: hypothetical protein VGG72_14805 [Bryobacteraceae bacterium]|jgi:hypothetical protein